MKISRFQEKMRIPLYSPIKYWIALNLCSETQAVLHHKINCILHSNSCTSSPIGRITPGHKKSSSRTFFTIYSIFHRKHILKFFKNWWLANRFFFYPSSYTMPIQVKIMDTRFRYFQLKIYVMRKFPDSTSRHRFKAQRLLQVAHHQKNSCPALFCKLAVFSAQMLTKKVWLIKKYEK